jgi:hypothetical protein
MSVSSHAGRGDLIWWLISGSSMPAEIPEHDIEALRLPRNWHSYVRSAVLNVVGIVRVAMLAGREALIENGAAKDARIHQLESEVAMLREEIRTVSARVYFSLLRWRLRCAQRWETRVSIPPLRWGISIAITPSPMR